jgi:hypothetical protein
MQYIYIGIILLGIIVGIIMMAQLFAARKEINSFLILNKNCNKPLDEKIVTSPRGPINEEKENKNENIIISKNEIQKARELFNAEDNYSNKVKILLELIKTNYIDGNYALLIQDLIKSILKPEYVLMLQVKEEADRAQQSGMDILDEIEKGFKE